MFGSDPDPRLDGFARWFTGDLRRHLDAGRQASGTFDIAFFGRTGVGKSTVLSTYGPRSPR